MNCRFTYCTGHLATHKAHRAIPPDAWKGIYVKLARSIEAATKVKRVRLYVKHEENHPMTEYAISGRVYDRVPAARIEYCEVPSSGRIDSPCGYQSKTCRGEPARCPSCHFTYCDRHIVFHVYRLAVPFSSWDTMQRNIERAADRVMDSNGDQLYRVKRVKTVLNPPKV